MADETPVVSDDGIETRSYLEIKNATQPGDKGSTTQPKKPPVQGATQVPAAKPPVTSQPAVKTPEFKTVEEAVEHARKLQKQLDDAQSQIGKQGNEVGELRERLAKVEASTVKQPEEPKIEPPKSYVERFNQIDALKGISEDNKKVLGIMFDALKDDLKQELRTSNPELEQRVNELQMNEYKRYWAQEAAQLQSEYPGVYEKHVPAIEKKMQEQWEAGKVPSVTEAFKSVAFDDVRQTAKPEADVKDTLNEEASIGGNKSRTDSPTSVDTKGMSKKDAFKAVLEERKQKGLPL